MPRTITSEEDLIQQYLAPLAAGAPGAFGLKDDCAIIQPQPGQDLVVTTDALVSGLHFFADETPEMIAWRALAVNISDLAAKGATPLYYLMALALPEAPTDDWMMMFAGGLKDAQDRYGISLIGGDTDHRPRIPLSITITAMGLVPEGRMVRRATAKIGDRIFVSGTLGDAPLGLIIRRNRETKRFPELDKEQRQFLLDRYLRPTARVELSALLLEHASAAMDLSDGLAKDLGRLCKASGVAAQIAFAELPLSGAAARVLAGHPEFAEVPACGGDDYEILATVPPARAEAFEEAALELGVAVTDIGEIVKGGGVTLLDANGKAMVLAKTGYDHF
jgi:thiamine-monophosphate kinase